MKLLTLSLLFAALTVAARAEFRTWSSADDASKNFEGEFISANKDSVAIKRKDGKQITLPLTKLCQADRDFISKQAEEKANAEKAKEAGTKLKETEMAKALNGKTVTLEGK